MKAKHVLAVVVALLVMTGGMAVPNPGVAPGEMDERPCMKQSETPTRR